MASFRQIFKDIVEGVRTKIGPPRRVGGRNALASFLLQGSSVGLYTNSWTSSRYEQVRHFRHWVYIAVNRIATDVAMHMPNLSMVRIPEAPGDRRKWLKMAVRERALTPLLSHEHLEPVRFNHPLLRLLSDPNDYDSSFDLWYETTLFLLLTGNSYWWMPRGGPWNLPLAIWVIPAHWMWAVVGRDRLISSYQVRPVEGNYVTLSIPADEVIHFRKKNTVSKIDGYAPLQALDQWVDTEESISKSRWFSFRNGAFPGVSIGFDANAKIPDKETLDRIEAKFMGRYSGEINTGKPIFVPPGCTVKKLQITPAEMMYIESADQIRDWVLAGFGVPASIAMISKEMTYGSVDASNAAYYQGTLNPLYRFYAQTVNHKLCPFYSKLLRLWWEDRTPQDPALREESIKTDFLVGAITPNEVRAVRGREAYPYGGDDPLVQGAMMTLPYGTGGRIVNINSASVPRNPAN